MSASRKKLISGLVTLGLVIGAISYLFYSSAGEAFEYYKHVDEVMQEPGKWQGKALQMHGFVVPGSIARKIGNQKIEYKFQAVNCGATMDVHFAGTVPDTFKDRAEVVLKGKLDGAGFAANEISAKCPSKYASRPDGPAQTLCTRGDTNVEKPSAPEPAN